MKTFHCDSCGNLVFFENVRCLNCGHTLGFLPERLTLSALEPTGNNQWHAMAAGTNDTIRNLCTNAVQYETCNWLVPPGQTFCVACALNEMIPDLSVAGNEERWRKFERAKRRLVYTILQLGLPMDANGNRPALRFRFLADSPHKEEKVLTGHLNGLITLNIIEADDAERERRRVNLHEPYRTVLGHLRHEVGHYYWDTLVANTQWLAPYRQLFGDEQQDYGAALKRHYQNGAPADWQARFVSSYASSHPWEDWAESWAHYFHIIDMVETAGSFAIGLKTSNQTTIEFERLTAGNMEFDRLLEAWYPLTHALNSINRGMGLHDVYPFVLSTPATEKLRFIDQVIKGSRAARPS